MTTEGTQISAFPGRDAPPGSIIPPTAAVMENATYVDAGPEIEKMVNGLIREREAFKDLRGVVVAVTWSRNQSRTLGGEQLLAWPALIGLLEQHYAKEAEASLPELAIILSYKAADAMRSEGQYIHPQVLERHIARALLGVEVSEGGVIRTRGADVQTYADLIGWYGAHSEGEQAMRTQLSLFDEREAGRQQRAGRRGSRAAQTADILNTEQADGEQAEKEGASDPSS